MNYFSQRHINPGVVDIRFICLLTNYSFSFRIQITVTLHQSFFETLPCKLLQVRFNSMPDLVKGGKCLNLLQMSIKILSLTFQYTFHFMFIAPSFKHVFCIKLIYTMYSASCHVQAGRTLINYKRSAELEISKQAYAVINAA